MAYVAIISAVLGFLTTNHLALFITPLQTYLHSESCASSVRATMLLLHQ